MDSQMMNEGTRSDHVQGPGATKRKKKDPARVPFKTINGAATGSKALGSKSNLRKKVRQNSPQKSKPIANDVQIHADPKEGPSSEIQVPVPPADDNCLIQTLETVKKHFDIKGLVGYGTYSEVYHAVLRENPSKSYALKHLLPYVKPVRMIKELRYLRDLGGRENVLGIESVIQENGHVVMVLPYFPHDQFINCFSDLSSREIRQYMKNLLIALRWIHSQGVIHRDIKPQNFLFNRELRKFALIDFGFAQNQQDLKKDANITTGYVSKRSKDVPSQPINPNQQGKYSGSPMNTTNDIFIKANTEKAVITKRSTMDVALAKSAPAKLYTASTRPCAFILSPQSSNAPQVQPSTPQTPSLQPQNQRINSLDDSFGEFQTPVKRPEVERPKVTNRVGMLKKPFLLSVQPSSIAPQNVAESIPGEDQPKPTHISKEKPPQIQVTKEAPNKGRSLSLGDLAEHLPPDCDCLGTEALCKGCLNRVNLRGRREGTRGFRAPEVLFNCQHQTTAIDIWSAGVIFLSLLSGRFPFFSPMNDFEAIVEQITIFGVRRMTQVANELGKVLTIKPDKHSAPANLRAICEELRVGTRDNEFVPEDSAYELLEQLLDPNPLTRISAHEALMHPYFKC